MADCETRLSGVDFPAPPEALAIADALREAGHEALFCGGAVRDALLGVKAKDFDIATSARPDDIERIFEKTIPVGKAFGVMVVIGANGGQYEVATFRSDSSYADGRHPDAVVFTSAEEDAKRRDFTINALFFDPASKEVIDYVGGIADIRNQVIKTVGVPDERFAEDKLRLLRAIRFAARTGFAIETETWAAIRRLADQAAAVAAERIAAELESMLTGSHACEAFAMLMDSGMLAHVLPEAARMRGVEQPPDYHPEGDVWIHTLLLLREYDLAAQGETEAVDHSALSDIDKARGMNSGEFSPQQYLDGVSECWQAFTPQWRTILAWAALLHDIGKPDTFMIADRIRFNEHDRLGAEMAEAVLERLRRPRKIVDAVRDLIHRHIHFSTLRKMRKSKLRRWLALESFPAHLELHRLDCVASHRMLGNWFFGLEAWREEKARPPAVEPLLSGKDVLALGLQPGPTVGAILRAIEDARLEGNIGTRREALAMAAQYIAQEKLEKNMIKTTELQHIGIYMTDPAAAADWYVKNMGFQIIGDFTIAANSVRAVFIRSQALGVTYELVGQPKGTPLYDELRKNSSVDHIAYTVEDVDAAFAQAKAENLDITEGIVEIPEFWEKGFRYFKVRTPTGESVEFCRIL